MFSQTFRQRTAMLMNPKGDLGGAGDEDWSMKGEGWYSRSGSTVGAERNVIRTLILFSSCVAA